MKSVLFPEEYYGFINHTLATIQTSLKEGFTITCIPKYVDRKRKEVVVKLGEGLYGYMPYEEVTIYKMFKLYSVAKSIPVQIMDILNKTIRAKVLRIEDDRIILSRRKNMLEALEYLKTCSFVRTHITRMSWSKVYGDIGEGIIGSMDIREISNTKINNVNEQFRKGDCIWLKVLSVEPNNTLFLSYKEKFDKYNPENYEIGSTVMCMVTTPVNNPISGYFVAVTPQVIGIINVHPDFHFLSYGSKVIARIIGKNEKGLKLKFIRFHTPSTSSENHQEIHVLNQETQEKHQYE